MSVFIAFNCSVLIQKNISLMNIVGPQSAGIKNERERESVCVISMLGFNIHPHVCIRPVIKDGHKDSVPPISPSWFLT